MRLEFCSVEVHGWERLKTSQAVDENISEYIAFFMDRTAHILYLKIQGKPVEKRNT